jgi:pimeloyl-ACP methyl ester carboxylesterase
MTTFVLVHGAGHGGWCWGRVAPLLRAAGHEVVTPTLTGLGERVHLLDGRVDLELHVTDIVNVLRYEDLHDVVLVGHSYGGTVITGAADRAPERVAKLVYLDAAFPGDGQSVADVVEPVEGLRANGEVIDSCPPPSVAPSTESPIRRSVRSWPGASLRSRGSASRNRCA